MVLLPLAWLDVLKSIDPKNPWTWVVVAAVVFLTAFFIWLKASVDSHFGKIPHRRERLESERNKLNDLAIILEERREHIRPTVHSIKFGQAIKRVMDGETAESVFQNLDEVLADYGITREVFFEQHTLLSKEIKQYCKQVSECALYVSEVNRVRIGITMHLLAKGWEPSHKNGFIIVVRGAFPKLKSDLDTMGEIASLYHFEHYNRTIQDILRDEISKLY
jgi:hypothetical protein